MAMARCHILPHNDAAFNQLNYFTPKLRTALFWAIMQGVAVIPYRRLGTTYRSRNVGKELPLLAA
jgi:hypothetical protein